jgi:hypothetical protein
MNLENSVVVVEPMMEEIELDIVEETKVSVELAELKNWY